MFLYKYVPRTPKIRHLNFYFFKKTKIFNKFSYKKFNKHFYKNNKNKKLIQKKIKIKKTPYFYKNNLFLFNISYIITHIFLKLFSKKFFLNVITTLGSYILKPLIFGTQKKKKYFKKYFYFFKSQKLPLGFKNFLYFFENLYFYSNLKYGTLNLCNSSGTFLKILNINVLKQKYSIVLPSKKKKSVFSSSLVILGRNSNIVNKKIKYGGFYSRNPYLSKFSKSTRGVAMNPVDHPNGGRSKTKGSFKTPWGKIAKLGK